MKVLIIRLSSAGDIVLTSPIIRCLKLQKNAEIHYLVKPAFAATINQNPHVDKVWLLHDDIDETIALLKSKGFDLILDMQKNLKSFRIRKGLDVKSISFNKLNLHKWIFVNFKINKLPQKHLVDRYFESVQSLGIKDDGAGLDYFISQEDELDALALVQGIHYDVLVLGANYYTKRIPLEKCMEIVPQCTRKVVLLGGTDVADVAKELATQFPEETLNFCGKLGLNVSAGIVKHAHRVITGDTGLMHIAAAYQKEIHVIWGNTHPAFGMYPYYGYRNKSRFQSYQTEGLSCRPCSKLGYKSCPKGHFKCMMENNVKLMLA
ncbi:MAG: glycosyltransferase family 9 protein [Saprospiraceae bacterium]|nr:glycosyltransferase family 9 protein [Saprospiraceae bacterium]